jgi:hypothetical protein
MGRAVAEDPEMDGGWADGVLKKSRRRGRLASIEPTAGRYQAAANRDLPGPEPKPRLSSLQRKPSLQCILDQCMRLGVRFALLRVGPVARTNG